ncbi:MAG TPA: GTPase domain-containing protein, partial [Myxococcota bacterium]
MNDAPDPSAVNARIVYWGAEGAGKRTNLRVIHAKLRPDHRGELRSVPTRIDPTVSYTTLPIELGEVGGVRTRLQIVAVPGEREHAPTRKQLLDRTDGVVLVLDARREKLGENLASLEELKAALIAYGRRIDEMPLVIQYNKRDVADPYALEDLHRKLAMRGVAAFEAVAKDGTGVLQTLTTISKRVIRHLREHGQAPAPAVKPAADASANAATQVRFAPAPAAAATPPPGVTQLID